MENEKTKIAIAVALKSLGYKSTHTHKGSAYYVVPKKYKAA
jgi:hypothetical protein